MAGRCRRLQMWAQGCVGVRAGARATLCVVCVSSSERVDVMDGQAADIEARVREIKAHMPQTYRSIQAKAQEIGLEAYAMVRRAIGGQANLFYAVECGRVVGTPFNLRDITADVAYAMVMFNTRSVILWGDAPKRGAPHGA
jgi:hypothetical protein